LIPYQFLQDDPTNWLLKPFPVEYKIAVGGFRKELGPVAAPSYQHIIRKFRNHVTARYIPSSHMSPLADLLATRLPIPQPPSKILYLAAPI